MKRSKFADGQIMAALKKAETVVSGYKHFKSLFAAAADVLPGAISVRLNCITVYLRDCIGKTAIKAQKYR